MPKPIILDLCGGTGSWSRPYADSGRYDVRIIDPQEWLDDAALRREGYERTGDVRLFKYMVKERPHGILAAPPCTTFAVSGARWWEEKGEYALLEALSVADACLRVCVVHKPKWWAYENPVGRLRHYIGPPRLIFNPKDYGDPWTKKTLIWGDFKEPVKTPVEATEGSKMHKIGPGPERARLRSETPPGWARAFFEANP